MKLSKISTDDPILTAYALGELDADEAARVAAAISHDSAALQVVHDIRSTAGELHAALKDEPILAAPAQPLVAAKSATIIRFPYYAMGAAAAACFAAVFAVRFSHQNAASAPVMPATLTVKAIVPADADVAAANRIAKVIPDGFSDLKPAPFRDSGYRLGKSIAASDHAFSSDTASASKIAPAPANSPSTSAFASDESAMRDETPHQLLSLKLSPQLPVVNVAEQVSIPLVNPRELAFSNQDVKFTGLPDFRTMLKDAPRGSTYEVLTWSTQDLDKKDQAEHRNDFIDLVKKQKNATVE